MIEVKNLTKRYGAERAVNRISFDVQAGEILGFLGPNGAGKTTTMKILTCYLPPSEGTAYINGMDVRDDTLGIRKIIGYLPESTPLYLDMDVYAYLDFTASMRGISAPERPDRIAVSADQCGLGDVLNKTIGTLSKGFKQRVGLAQAMIHDPDILILDEPTSGLDPNQRVEIRDLIKSLGSEKTVILSTHILPEVQATCDRVLIINRGEIVADGTMADLEGNLGGGQRVVFGVTESTEGVEESLLEHGFEHIERLESSESGMLSFRVVSNREEDARAELFALAVQKGWSLLELHREQFDLEDVFRELTAV